MDLIHFMVTTWLLQPVNHANRASSFCPSKQIYGSSVRAYKTHLYY